MVTINWNEYRKKFPDRYITEGFFDKEKDLILNSCKGKDILDIGGGILGSCNSGQAANNNVWLLDPFIDNIPSNYKGKIGWDKTDKKFDLIICRGSFNYLTFTQIYSIRNLLKVDGILMFNTFLEAKEIFREYTIKSITSGIEKTVVTETQVAEVKTVHHYLIPYEGLPIYHTFWHYPDSIIRRVLFKGMNIHQKFPDNVEYQFYKGNSTIYYIDSI